MKIYAVIALVLLVIGSSGAIWSLGAENARLKQAAARHKITLKQLKKDGKSVEGLQKRNAQLKRRLDDAKTVFVKVKDTTGCFRAVVPTPASNELRNLYNSISGGS